MKPIKLFSALLLLALASVGSAWADHGHYNHYGHHGGGVNFGVMIGPYWGPYYYPPAPYYYPPVVIERQVPQVYIEQQPMVVAPVPAAAPTNDWYYCFAAKGYYPYVKDCPGGWQKVSPQPPSHP